MGFSSALLVLLLLRSALSISDDVLEVFDSYFPPEDVNNEIDAIFANRPSSRGGDKFLRFGKTYIDYNLPSNINADENPSSESQAELTPTGNNDLERLQKKLKSSYIRFGRSIDEINNNNNKTKRDKRQTNNASDSLKRHENYLRFGRSSHSNFMRFGRNFMYQPTTRNSYDDNDDLINIKPTLNNLRNKYILEYLRNLRQSQENRHRN